MGTGRIIMVNFKVNAEELEMIKRGAEKEGLTQSNYIRTCILRDRFLDGDSYALKNFKENLSGYVRDTGEAFQKAFLQALSPFRVQRKAPKGQARPKGEKKK